MCRGPDIVQGAHLIRVHRDDEFSNPVVRDPVVRAILVKRLLAVNAQPGFQAVLRVIDSGVDDFAIARTRFRADGVLTFQDDHFTPAHRQFTCNRESDDTRTDNDALYAFSQS